ncbi:MAG: hypothetical protein H5T69_16880, partial [Chloroflexi bacterium]|nr:hypothetical protein [Chloroflexota bacterium]
LGGVTLLEVSTRRESRFESGRVFSMEELGPCRMPEPGEGIAEEVWSRALAAEQERRRIPEPSAEVLELVRQREAARAQRDWATGDRLRERIKELGWQVRDTPNGPELAPL